MLRTTALGAVALGSGAILSACGGGQQQPQAPASEEPAPAAEPMEEPMAEAGCSDLSGLSEADIQMRQTLQYVETSQDPAKVCSGCQLFIAPEGEAMCGGCQIIKGPISPGGYCTSWAQKMT